MGTTVLRGNPPFYGHGVPADHHTILATSGGAVASARLAAGAYQVVPGPDGTAVETPWPVRRIG